MKKIVLIISIVAAITIAANAQGENDFVSTREMERINWMEFKAVVPLKTTTVLLPTGTLDLRIAR